MVKVKIALGAKNEHFSALHSLGSAAPMPYMSSAGAA